MKIKLLITTLLLTLFSIEVSAQGTREPYVILNDGTLTFYYNAHKPSGAFDITNSTTEKPVWTTDAYALLIKKVVFDVSFNDYRPTSCYYWFTYLENLSEIEHLEYLHTDKVTTLQAMFGKCKKLKSLNLSTFNTSKVTSMRDLLKNCEGLKSVNLSSFDTRKVTDMGCMFENCQNLASIDVSNFNTSLVTDMNCMFNRCYLLESLNLSNFNTAKVTNYNWMFQYSSSLTTIYVSDKWIAANGTSNAMFYDCNSLVGGKGTTYNADYTDATYAKIDGGEDNPGYFTKSGNPAFKPSEATGTITQSGIKIWSVDNTVHMESAPDTKNTIIILNGCTHKASAKSSSKKGRRLNQSGFVEIIINGESYKLSL